MAQQRYKVTLELRPMTQDVDGPLAAQQVLLAVREKFPALRPKVVA
jgi:hypothetical protein